MANTFPNRQAAADATGIAQLGESDPVAEMIVNGDDADLQARLDRRRAVDAHGSGLVYGSWLLETAEQTQRWHNQMHAARAGHCPQPPNGGPADDLYEVDDATFTGNAPLQAALARAAGHVFVAGDTDAEAWCVRCDHRARIWTLRRVFLPAGTPCAPAPDPAAAAVSSPSSEDQR